jgi:hypothetical protein
VCSGAIVCSTVSTSSPLMLSMSIASRRRLLGIIRDLWGAPDQEVRALGNGVVLFLTTSPAVSEDGLLLGLGTGLAPIAT